MGDPVRSDGLMRSWEARCKDCVAEERAAAGFSYSDAHRDDETDLGHNPSDRCPKHRTKHGRAIKSLAVPYVQLQAARRVADPGRPAGPLGGLGPLPVEHVQHEHREVLNAWPFSLTDQHMRDLLDALRETQVAVVVAGTSSGKSTFLPYCLLNPPPGATYHPAVNGRIVMTEPRLEATYRTAETLAVMCGGPDAEPGPESPIGYRTSERRDRLDDSNALAVVTDGTLKQWLIDGRLGEFGAVIIDEAHELNSNIEFILAVLARERHRYPDLRIIVASATIDANVFVDHFGGPDEVFTLPVDGIAKDFGYGHPLWPTEPVSVGDPAWAHPDWDGDWAEIGSVAAYTELVAALRVTEKEVDDRRGARGWQERMPSLVVEQVGRLVEGTEAGDILAFLPGRDAIDDVRAKLRGRLSGRKDVVVLEYLRDSSDREKAKVTGPRNPARRRVILATNLAETSLTIDGLRFVIDTGLIKQTEWDPITRTESLRIALHSRQGVRQRWGRVGRTEPGWVLPLYSRRQFSELMPENTPPEAARSNLEPFALDLAAAGIDDVPDLRMISGDERTTGAVRAADHRAELTRAVKVHDGRGATEGGALTAAGHELRGTGSRPMDASIVAVADRLGCAPEAATVIAILGARDLAGGVVPFSARWEPSERLRSVRAFERLAADCADDAEMALRIAWAWERSSEPEKWANNNGLDHNALLAATEARDALIEPLLAGVRRASGNLAGRPLDPALLGRVRAAMLHAAPETLIARTTDDSWAGSDDRLVLLTARTAAEPTIALSMLAIRRFRARRLLTVSNLVDVTGVATGTTLAALAMSSGRVAATDLDCRDAWQAWLDRLTANPLDSTDAPVLEGGAWEEVEVEVVGTAGGWGSSLVAVASDRGGTVLGGADLSLARYDGSVHERLAIGDRITVVCVPDGAETRWSARPLLVERLHALPVVLDQRGRPLNRGLVVHGDDTGVIVELAETGGPESLALRVGSSGDILERPVVGEAVHVRFRNIGDRRLRLPPGVTPDRDLLRSEGGRTTKDQNGDFALVLTRPPSRATFGELLALSGEPAWDRQVASLVDAWADRHVVDVLVVEPEATTSDRLARWRDRARSGGLEGVVRIVRDQRIDVEVIADDESLWVHVSQDRIGPDGVLDPTSHVAADDVVRVVVDDVELAGDGSVRGRGSAPALAVPTLEAQVLVLVGSNVLAGVVKSRNDSGVRVADPARRAAPSVWIPISKLRDRAVREGSSITVVMTGFGWRNGRINVVGHQAGFQALLPIGSYPVTVTKPTTSDVTVLFDDGATRRVFWRNIGTGLLFPNAYDWGDRQYPLEVAGHAEDRKGKPVEELRLDVRTDALVEQARDRLMGRTFTTTVTKFEEGRAQVELVAGLRSWVDVAHGAAQVGSELAVIVSGVRTNARHGGLVLRLRRAS